MRASSAFSRKQTFVPKDAQKLMKELRKSHFTFGRDYDAKVNPKNTQNNGQNFPYEAHFIAR
jgi:hypothetical protein